jgi:hypothetical protein
LEVGGVKMALSMGISKKVYFLPLKSYSEKHRPV